MRPFLVPILLAVLITGCTGADRVRTSQPDRVVVASIDGTPVYLSEFEAQYLRTSVDTVAAANDSLAAYQDFLERYVDFRLKVDEAGRAGYADRPDLIQEMGTYRQQLARPYLLEREVMEPLIRDLYEKKKLMVDVSHILLRVDENASPGDTLRAYGKLAAIADSAGAGADFGALAVRHSEDPSARDAQRGVGYGGRLGWFGGGRMVKPFEDTMFATPIDSMSGIFRTQFGFHVLKVHGRREAVPDVRISHIMIQPRGQASADSADAAERLAAVVSRLEAGEAFADVAREASDDKASAPRGGDLDFVSYDGWLPAEMRDVVFEMDSVGTVSLPIMTRFGMHLVHLTGRKDLPDFQSSYEDLKQEVARLPRAKKAEETFARQVIRDRNGRIDSDFVAELLGTQAPDSLVLAIIRNDLPEAYATRSIATLGDSTYTLRQFGSYAKDNPATGVADPQAAFQQSLAAFLNERAIAYEVDALEARDAEFRGTMQEFRDGLMLFRFMEDSVWTAASTDSAALESFYAGRASEYMFPERTRILGISAGSDSLLQSIISRLDAGIPFGALVDAYPDGGVRFDTTMVEGTTESIYDQAIALDAGDRTDVLTYAGGRIVLVNDGTEAPRVKTFAEARAEVVNGYQVVLEQRMLSRLRMEHAVSTHPEHLDKAFLGYRNDQ